MATTVTSNPDEVTARAVGQAATSGGSPSPGKMTESRLRFRWLAALALWTSMIGPVLATPVMMVRSTTEAEEHPRQRDGFASDSQQRRGPR